MRPPSRGYYIKYNQNTGLNGISDAAWGGIGSAIQGVAALGTAAIQAFTIKKQVDAMIEKAKIEADATKYVADKQVDIAKIQQEVALKAQEKEELQSTKAAYTNHILYARQIVAALLDKVVSSRNVISPNLKYILLKQQIDISSFATICTNLYNNAVAVVNQYADKIKEESIITTTITSSGNKSEVQSLFNNMSVLYRNQILALQKILLACEGMSEEERAIYFLSLYFFDRNNYVFGVYANQLVNSAIRLDAIAASESMPTELVNIDINADWENKAAIKEYIEKNGSIKEWADKNNEIVQKFLLQPAIGYYQGVRGKRIGDEWNDYYFVRGLYPSESGMVQSFGLNKYYNEETAYDYSLGRYNSFNFWSSYINNTNYNLRAMTEDQLTALSKVLSIAKKTDRTQYTGPVYELPQPNYALKEKIDRKKSFLSSQQIDTIDVLQVFFNELRSVVSQSNIIEALKKSITQYYDYEKNTYFIEAAYFENTLTTMLFSSVDKIKYIFDNIYTAMRESVQIRFLQGLFGSVETLTYNNQEYLLGLMLSFILSGKAPYIDKNIIELIKQKLKEVDSSMQVEVKNIILQNLYMEYNMNDMMKKDINFAQEYDKNTLQGTYSNQSFLQNSNDEGLVEDPFAVLDILRYLDKKEDTPLTDVFMQDYLPTQQSTYFITGMEALSVAQFLASRKQANMPDIVVSNLVIEVPLLKQLNQKYRFTRLSFFLFLQELYNQICGMAKANTLHIAEQIVRGQTKVQTLTNKDEEAQAKVIFDYFSNGQMSFKKIIHPEFVMDNNVAMVALQLGDTITEGAQIITTNAYLRVIFLIKENFAQYINEFEFDNLYVVTLSNNKRVGELRDANEEAYAVQYAQLANENADYLKALSEYIWAKDALITIAEKPITLSVYNRTMTILKEQYGKQIAEPIINLDSTAKKTNEMLTTEELQKKKTNQALGWGTAALVLWKIFG